MIERFFDIPVFGPRRAEKHALFDSEMLELTSHHRAACAPYDAIISSYGSSPPGGTAAPFLPVGLFKLRELSSVSQEAVFKTMTSSGTSGQLPSRIVLDASTAGNQTRVLARIMSSFLGQTRQPMLIFDHPGVIKDRRTFSARGAGVLGMMMFGRAHAFALKDETMELDWETIDRFLASFAELPILAFGFTFMVWRYVFQGLEAAGRTLPFKDAVLIHSGGWKKLESEKVSNDIFKQQAASLCGLTRVHNFYGMVEQTGSVYVECEAGRLHAPLFADILVRDPLDWRECRVGERGVIQTLSVLPRSYPGHSLLTEDCGEIIGEDDCPCGRMGRTFIVHGRIPKAEIRGCSDTFVATA